MDVRLSPEQEALRDSVAQVGGRLGAKTVAALDDAERRVKLDAAVEASGWRELRVAGDGGEPWASGVEVALVAEELGQSLADTAFIGPTLSAELRRLVGSRPSTAPETVAMTPNLGGAGEHVAIDADRATVALAVRGDAVLEVALGAPLAAVDLTRASAGVDCSTGRSIGRLTADDATRWNALGLAVTCADLVGTMRGAADLASSYARERHQYGVAVGSFQAVQHLLADAYVATEGARSIMLYAAWSVDALAPEAALAAAAAAKAYCSRAARGVCETAIQVYGGIGNTWDCLAHVYLRRALLSTDILGGAGASLARVLHHHGIGASVGLR